MIYYYYLDDPQKGKRLFKHDAWNNTVIQVVVHPGVKKKGRPNMKGIYRISEATLKSNYMWRHDEKLGLRIKQTTKKLFELHAYAVLNELLKDKDHG